MKTSRNLAATFLACLIILSLSVPAFATEGEPYMVGPAGGLKDTGATTAEGQDGIVPEPGQDHGGAEDVSEPVQDHGGDDGSGSGTATGTGAMSVAEAVAMVAGGAGNEDGLGWSPVQEDEEVRIVMPGRLKGSIPVIGTDPTTITLKLDYDAADVQWSTVAPGVFEIHRQDLGQYMFRMTEEALAEYAGKTVVVRYRAQWRKDNATFRPTLYFYFYVDAEINPDVGGLVAPGADPGTGGWSRRTSVSVVDAYSYRLDFDFTPNDSLRGAVLYDVVEAGSEDGAGLPVGVDLGGMDGLVSVWAAFAGPPAGEFADAVLDLDAAAPGVFGKEAVLSSRTFHKLKSAEALGAWFREHGEAPRIEVLAFAFDGPGMAGMAGERVQGSFIVHMDPDVEPGADCVGGEVVGVRSNRVDMGFDLGSTTVAGGPTGTVVESWSGIRSDATLVEILAAGLEGPELPKTGGSGTGAYVAVGTVLVVVAGAGAIWYAARKRKDGGDGGREA